MKPYLVNLLAALIFSCLTSVSFAQLSPYELQGKNYTATYQECIDYYKQLDRNFKCVSMQTMGMTDAGLPLHVVLISSGKNDPAQWQDEKKVVFLINNGIIFVINE